jgi:WD40 repeat protein
VSDETADRSGDHLLLTRLADEFAARYRAGERPALQEYIDRHPELADDIRELFPAMVEMEQAKENHLLGGEPAVEGRVPALRQIGDFRIIREVGKGGMGIVYEAEQVSLGRRVALKILPRHLVGDRKSMERFRREAKAAARLHHTNIVPVFEVGRDRGVAFYAMQFIQGQGLDQVIDELARLRGSDRKCSGDRHAGSSGPSEPGITVQSSGAAASGLRNRRLGQVAESLLSGRLGSEGLKSPAGPASATMEATGTDPFDPAAITDALSLDTGGHVPQTPPAADVSGSAVLPGGTAVSTIESSGRRTPYFRSVAQIGRQAAQGLAYAHSRGIVHRDIKPSNLLLDTAGIVWITDFGLAKAEEDGLTATGDILGTLRYMAPERFRGEGDARADVYGLGLTLYELLTLRPAFESSDRLKLMERIKNEEPLRPRSLDTRIPRDLETIVLKASDKDPNRRYPTAEAMAEDLRRFLSDEPILARQTSTAERYVRWARRNPIIAVLGGVLTAVLVLATIGSLVAAGRFAGLAADQRLAALTERASRLDADRARDDARQTRNASARQAAALLLDRGIENAQRGEPATALHLFVQALRALPPGDPRAEPLERVIRANLTGWAECVPALEHIWTGQLPMRYFGSSSVFNTDGKRAAFPVGDTGLQCFRTDTGQPVGPLVKLPGGISATAFAADGRSIWVGSSSHTGREAELGPWAIFRIDPVSGHSLQPPIPTTGPAQMLTVTPDGRYLVGAVNGLHPSDTGPAPDAMHTRKWRMDSILVWATAGGRIVRKVEVKSSHAFSYVRLSSDAKTVIAWVLHETQAFEGVTFSVDGNEAPMKLGLDRAVHWHPFQNFHNDMRTALVITDGHIHRWSGSNPGVLTAGVPAPFRMMHSSRPPDGRSVMSWEEGRLFDVGTWPLRPSGMRFAHPAWEGNEFSSAQFSPDGRFVMTMIEQSVQEMRLWANPRPHSRPPKQSTEAVQQTNGRFWPGVGAFDAHRSRVLLDRAPFFNDVRLVDTATGMIRGLAIRHGSDVIDAQFSPDAKYFATGSADMWARVWEAATGRPAGPRLEHTNYVAAVAFNPDGTILATGDYGPAGRVVLWDWRTGKRVREWRLDDIVVGVSFSPDGKYLAAVKAPDWSKRAELWLWEVASGTPVAKLPFMYRKSGGETAVFRPDGRAVLAVDINGVLRMWAVPSGRLLGERTLDGRQTIRFAPDGQTLAVAASRGVRLLDPGTLAPLSSGYLPHASAVTDIAFSPEGTFLLTGHMDGSSQLWDLGARKTIGPPAVLIGDLRAVAFSADGQTCLAVAADGTIRRWPVPTPVSEADVDHLADRVALMTGQRMDENQGMDFVAAPEWQLLRARLAENGSTALVPPRSAADWHDARAADAEQDGDAYGALWHLDWLAERRPRDWTVAARRGRVLLADGRRDLAAAAYATARSLATVPGDVADWLRAAAADEERNMRYETALWNLDRSIELTSDDWTLYAARAALEDRAGHANRAASDLDAAVRLGAEASVIAQGADRAAARATRPGDWARVAKLLTTAAGDPNLPIEDRSRSALALMKAGDGAGYRDACAGITKTMPPAVTQGGTSDALDAVWAFTIGPNATDAWATPLSWLDPGLTRVTAASAESPAAMERHRATLHALLRARGALLHRAGRFEEAAKVLRGAVALDPQGGAFHDWLFLALAERALSQRDAATAAAARARAARPERASGSAWDRAEVELLGAELDAAVPPPGK